MQILKDYSLKSFNTFKINVSAKYFAKINSTEDISKILSDQKLKAEKKFILGGGSNILFTKNYDGLIINVAVPGINIVDDDNDSVLIEAGGGVTWNDLVKFCVDKNFGGIENLTLIPGSVGAAPIQNIGAYGQEVSDIFISLDGFLLDAGENKTFSKDECQFSYRTSIFKKELKNKLIVTSIRLRLSKNPKLLTSYGSIEEILSIQKIINPTIKDISKVIAWIRQGKLPDVNEIGNAGSFFKNPVINKKLFDSLKKDFPGIISFPTGDSLIKISAGWLIEQCGWKGKRVGDVGTYSKHALVIVNYDSASGNEVLEFAMRVKEEVEAKFGITLEEEVNIV